MQFIKKNAINIWHILFFLFIEVQYSIQIPLCGKTANTIEKNVLPLKYYRQISTIFLTFKYNLSEFETQLRNYGDVNNCLHTECLIEHSYLLDNIHWNVSNSEWVLKKNSHIIHFDFEETNHLTTLIEDYPGICERICDKIELMFITNSKLNALSDVSIDKLNLFTNYEKLLMIIEEQSNKKNEPHFMPTHLDNYAFKNFLSFLHMNYKYEAGFVYVEIGVPMYEKNPIELYRKIEGGLIRFDYDYQITCRDERELSKSCRKFSIQNEYLCREIKCITSSSTKYRANIHLNITLMMIFAFLSV